MYFLVCKSLIREKSLIAGKLGSKTKGVTEQLAEMQLVRWQWDGEL